MENTLHPALFVVLGLSVGIALGTAKSVLGDWLDLILLGAGIALTTKACGIFDNGAGNLTEEKFYTLLGLCMFFVGYTVIGKVNWKDINKNIKEIWCKFKSLFD